MITPSEIYALAQVLLVDLALAGDNAIVVGMVAASVPEHQRKKVIFIGILIATVLRIVFSLGAVQLLQIIGLMLAGGVLLLWVAWKLWREIQQAKAHAHPEHPGAAIVHKEKSFGQAVFQITLADVSMSLDNVLAVAGAAREHTWVLVTGLTVSVALMAVASTKIAELLKRHHWIAYVGLLVIFAISISMIYEGAIEVYGRMN
jgi:YjbE family integral membrane protein